MLRTLGWAIWIMFYFIGYIPKNIKAKRMVKKGLIAERDAYVRGLAEKWTKTLLKHIKMDVQVLGRENLPKEGQTVVFTSNHQSFLDIPVMFASLDKPHALMARKEIGKVPLLRGWMEQLRCILIERDDARAAMDALKEGEELLKSGHSLTIFPEGTRSKMGEVAEFKAGAIRIAYRTGVNIVPVAVQGTGYALEQNGKRLRKSKVVVSILPQVQTQGLDRAAQKALPQQIEDMVRAEVERHAGVNEK